MKIELYSGYTVDICHDLSLKALNYIDALLSIGAAKDMDQAEMVDVVVYNDNDLLFHGQNAMRHLREDWKNDYSFKLAEAQKECVCTSM